MNDEMLKGFVMVVVAGLSTGAGWQIKFYRKFRYEQWGFLAAVLGMVIIPWTAVLIACHGFSNTAAMVGDVVAKDLRALLVGNAIAACWGCASVMCALCFVRIGLALTAGILTGLGMATGVVVPMIFKGSGKFADAPDVFTKPGMVVVGAVVVMLVAVMFVVLAGLGKDRALKSAEVKAGGRLENPMDFYAGLTMAIIMGVLSAGLGLSFVYSGEPIKTAMSAHQATDLAPWFAALSKEFAALAMGAFVAILMNIAYPAYLMTKNKSWGMLKQSPGDWLLVLTTGIQGIATFPLMFKGMDTLGAFGASVGLGMQQSLQMIGSQIVGFASGEWRGVKGRPRKQMYLAIVILLTAAAILGYGRWLFSKGG